MQIINYYSGSNNDFLPRRKKTAFKYKQFNVFKSLHTEKYQFQLLDHRKKVQNMTPIARFLSEASSLNNFVEFFQVLKLKILRLRKCSTKPKKLLIIINVSCL
jgi:hypothetical protein